MKQLVKHLLVGLLGLVALAYLLNPTAGIFECLPDNIPILGNLDEAAATTILLGCLGYFGIDLSRWFRRPRHKYQ
jgi:hypothetical protein